MTKPNHWPKPPIPFTQANQNLLSHSGINGEFDDDVSPFKRIVQQSWNIDESYEMISALIKQELGLDLPSGLRDEFGRVVVAETFARRGNLSDLEIPDLFEQRYSLREAPLFELKDYMINVERGPFQNFIILKRSFEGIVSVAGTEHNLVGRGNGPISSLANALKGLGLYIQVRNYEEHAIGEGKDVKAAAFLEVAEESQPREKFRSVWGVAIHEDVVQSSLLALLSAASQLYR
ncbi:2-isopropylmalate synthase LeuA, allosteric domain-containing protein [Dactylonectria estremocensis]|uniref:2-isopropylmalate synthase LeuA, allosteric domain-containing protein n=1 Tax=Dactylonectria estremocensis TaxID=1079267 RepID=A0A9P9IYD0_9HYPO|nr:2-isopropylmalate synthase LeuA, allosteric domain-containing protein [Dactylonectria estremocensis]